MKAKTYTIPIIDKIRIVLMTGYTFSLKMFSVKENKSLQYSWYLARNSSPISKLVSFVFENKCSSKQTTILKGRYGYYFVKVILPLLSTTRRFLKYKINSSFLHSEVLLVSSRLALYVGYQATI